MFVPDWETLRKELRHGVLVQGDTSTFHSEVILRGEVIAEGFITDSRRSLSVESVYLIPAIPIDERRCEKCRHRSSETVTSQVDLCEGVEQLELHEIPVDIVLDLAQCVLEARVHPAIRAPSVGVGNANE